VPVEPGVEAPARRLGLGEPREGAGGRDRAVQRRPFVLALGGARGEAGGVEGTAVKMPRSQSLASSAVPSAREPPRTTATAPGSAASSAITGEHR
jgi:hypothetical protein